MERRFKTTIYLDPVEYRRLKEIAETEGSSAAEQIREAITEYVARRTTTSLPSSLAAGSSGRGDLSEKGEKLLKGFGRR
jgi:predicted transcriptional regulator